MCLVGKLGGDGRGGGVGIILASLTLYLLARVVFVSIFLVRLYVCGFVFFLRVCTHFLCPFVHATRGLYTHLFDLLPFNTTTEREEHQKARENKYVLSMCLLRFSSMMFVFHGLCGGEKGGAGAASSPK